jgi:hypothetical protein
VSDKWAGVVASLPYAFCAAASLAALTWFFSTRPRLFVRVFVPPDELFSAGRHFLRDKNFRSETRWMAGLQLAVACAFGLVWLWFRF